MYIREWKCVCPEKHEQGFIAYLQETGIGDTQSIDACTGYRVLRGAVEHGIEITFMTSWISLEAMKQYSGDNLYKAVLYPDDDKYEIEPELDVKVYEVIASLEDS